MVLVALFVSGVQLWLREKSYVFSARELTDITTGVLRTSKGDPNSVRILLVNLESVAQKFVAVGLLTTGKPHTLFKCLELLNVSRESDSGL